MDVCRPLVTDEEHAALHATVSRPTTQSCVNFAVNIK